MESYGNGAVGVPFGGIGVYRVDGAIVYVKSVLPFCSSRGIRGGRCASSKPLVEYYYSIPGGVHEWSFFFN